MPVVVLGHDFWVGQFGARPSVVGSRIRLNGIEFTVIGVAPEHFTGIDTSCGRSSSFRWPCRPRMGQKNYLHDRDFGWLVRQGPAEGGASGWSRRRPISRR